MHAAVGRVIPLENVYVYDVNKFIQKLELDIYLQ